MRASLKIVLAGGSGFLGRALAARLTTNNHDVVVLSRKAAPDRGRVRTVAWTPDGSASSTPQGRAAGWAAEIDGADAIVNLAGEGIADRRWNEARKRALVESRRLSTRSLVAAIRIATRRPATFVQASAIGYYGTPGDQILDESSPSGSDFLGRLCVGWEDEAHPVAELGCRLAIVRNGIVLARNGGALKKMLLPFTLFAGGPIASGRQYMSWIEMDDWTSLVAWLITTSSASGVFNATAPEPVTNSQFSKALGRAVHRPSWLPVPGVALRILVGELADAGLINGQRVVPKHALALGFAFKHPEIDAGLAAALRVRG